ncbi:MAG: nuclear transport factor 2 family protein [Pigmentiphaga sp.]
MTDTLESFSAMLRDALGNRLDPNASSFIEMFHPNGVMEFPYAFGDMPKRLVGRDALAQHLAVLSRLITFDRMSKATVTETLDLDLVILEFEGFGTGVATGEPYDQRYLSIIRMQGRYIAHYKDYWNPLAAVRALYGSEGFSVLTKGEAHHG